MDSKNGSQFGFIDIFFFVLFITAIAIFLGLSIVTVIDKKINNVSINMPTIEPKVVLNIDKDKNGNIKISHNKKNDKDTIEEFIVADAQNIQHYDQLREATLALPDNFDMENLDNPDNKEGINYDKNNPIDDLPEQVVHHITKPLENPIRQIPCEPTIIIDRSVPSGAEPMNTSVIQVGATLPATVPGAHTVPSLEITALPTDRVHPSAHTVPKILKEMTANKYETEDPTKILVPSSTHTPNRNYITAGDFGSMAAPTQYIACQNSNDLGNTNRAISCKDPVAPHIPCNLPNKLTAENFYKTHYLGQIIPMDDYTTKGYNYWEYSDAVSPRTMRYQRILSQNTKGLPPEDTRYKNIPVGWNYGFHNTPMVGMP